MVLASAPEGQRGDARFGQARFIPAARMAEECAELRARRFLVAGAAPVPLSRGRLREAIDEAVEGALAMRGALPPCASMEAPLEPSIRDQLIRAKAVGLSGIVVALPRLGSVAGDRGELEMADGTALAAWMQAVREEPIILLLDEADRGVRVVAPIPLAQLVPEPARANTDASAGTDAGTDTDADTVTVTDTVTGTDTDSDSDSDSDSGSDIILVGEATTESPPPVDALSVTPDMPAIDKEIDKLAATVTVTVTETETVIAALALATAPPALPTQSQPVDPIEPVEIEMAAEKLPPARPKPPAPPPPPKPARETRGEFILSAAERRSYAMELDAARGPKPARVIDQLFTTRYIPLLAAVMRGEADAAVKNVVDAFRTSFEHSYRESFASIRVTGRRPSMVFDAPEIAAKVGRVNGARAVKLVLVDSMSFDLGERVMSRLKPRVEDGAVCVERTLLWSALPTNTTQQLALLARGEAALRDAPLEAEPETEITRGRAVSTLRRERLGSREVMKLDCVEARLRLSGPPYDERLDAIAEEVAHAVARFMGTLQPRTLLYLFGDHGFRLGAPEGGGSTGPATQGGPSPEEVLVPGYSWLAGGVH